MAPNNREEDHSNSLWVFGYGSLCWRPGFQYGDSVIGHIKGFSRKFWQGNTTHRGTPEKPGRVATLIEDRDAETYGVAFQLINESALEYLNNREVALGGYISHITMFQPRDKSRMPMPVLLYVATPSNEHWLGHAPAEHIANQVLESRGDKGHNVEYVLKLAEWIRANLPDVIDDHLFDIEKAVRQKIHDQSLCLPSLMGDSHDDHMDHAEVVNADDANHANSNDAKSADDLGFSSQVRPCCLRCTKV